MDKSKNITLTVDEYLANVTPTQLAEFERIRSIVKQVVPDTEEVISYGIPTFKYKGTYLLYFGAFKDHMSVFPGGAIVGELKEKLAGYKMAKGTIQFTEKNLLPESIIKDLLEMRLAAIIKK